MILSLIKVILFVLLIAGLTLVAGGLSDTEAPIRISLAGWEFTLGPLQAAIVAVVLVVLVWLVFKLIGLLFATLRFLNGDETALSRYFDRNREQKGYKALSEGMMALASGEHRLALSRAQSAERLLAKPELTTLLVAQAAEASGDRSRATEAYKSLLSDDRTRFVGVRGLMKQKLSEGDTETALKLAEKAFALRPKHLDTQDVLLKLQSESGDWRGARTTLGAKLKSGALPRDVFKRRDAILALQEAKIVVDDASTIEMREAAIEANKLSPDLIPAAAMAARTYLEKGDKKNATRVLKKAWGAQPHPDLAAVFAEVQPDETPAQRLKRFRVLTAQRVETEETRMLLAELQIAVEDFPSARRALGDLAVRHPTQRSLALLAAIERGVGADDALVRELVSRAMSAPRGPQWCCEKCQAIYADWRPICDTCAGFDTLTWREPPGAAHERPTLSQLLPLMAGAIEKEAATDASGLPADAEIVEDGKSSSAG